MKKPNFKIDEIILVLIVAVLIIVVSVYDKANQPKNEIEKITGMLTDGHSTSFAPNGVIDESKLIEIQKMSYDYFKKSLKVKNDFCVYVEDGNGNIIFAKGSSKLNGNGVVCG